MSGMCEHGGDDALERIRALAYAMEPPAPHERRGILRSESGKLLLDLLTQCANGIGAIDVALGEGLAALGVGDRLAQLGYANRGDYARERLDMAARAREATVHTLSKAVRDAGAALPDEDEPWDAVYLDVPIEAKPLAQRAFAAAGKILGATAPIWERLEAILQEYLGGHPWHADDDARSEVLLHAPVPDVEGLKADLEKLTQEWAFVDRGPSVIAPVPSEPVMSDPWLLDGELRRLARLRRTWDDAFAHMAMIFRMLVLWRDAGFASFAHCCEELFGMSVRAVEQRIALARRLYYLPALRQAMRDGRISYEKARLIAWKATDATVEEWIRRAEGTTCIRLRRELEAEETAQMCTRRGMDLRMPRHVRILLGLAFTAARAASGKRIPERECLRMVFQHFGDVWEPLLRQKSTPARRARARDGGYCLVPTCSRAGGHGHHVDYRSHGGSDGAENLASLCPGHHLHGVHKGYIRVRGKAPDALHWELGVRPGMPPLEEFHPATSKARKKH